MGVFLLEARAFLMGGLVVGRFLLASDQGILTAECCGDPAYFQRAFLGARAVTWCSVAHHVHVRIDRHSGRLFWVKVAGQLDGSRPEHFFSSKASLCFRIWYILQK
jgi:hypothetical protein